MDKEYIVPSIDKDGWIRCGECGAKLGRIINNFIAIKENGLTGVAFETKCKAKQNGKTCNSINKIEF